MRRYFFFALLLCACTRSTAAAPFVLRIAAVGTLAPLAPTTTETFTEIVKPFVYRPFLSPDERGRWRSDVLVEWTRTGPRTMRMKLAPGLRFSDGEPVTSEAAIHALARFELKAREEAGWLIVTPMGADAPLDPLLLEAVLFEDAPDGTRGTGPFEVERADGDRIDLVRRAPAPDRIDRVELVRYASGREAFSRALVGEVNALLMLAPPELDLLADMHRLEVVSGPGLHAISLRLNPRHLDRQERRQLVRAIPAAALARQFDPRCAPLSTEEVPGADVPKGAPLSILFPRSIPHLQRAALALQRALGDRGGPLLPVSTNDFYARALRGDFDLLLVPTIVWPPTSARLVWHSGSGENFSGYSNPQVDAALDAGDYERAEALLREDAAGLEICREPRTIAVDARLEGVRVGPFDLLETLPSWRVKQ